MPSPLRLFRTGPVSHRPLHPPRPSTTPSPALVKARYSSSTTTVRTTPTCPCASTSSTVTTPPNLPLPIDRTTPLRNTIAPYAQHLVICTSQRDWTSRIEEDGVGSGWGEVGRGVRGMVSARAGRRGEFVDPYNNILITHSSFPPAEPTSDQDGGKKSASALLFPSFTYLAHIPTDSVSLRSLVRAFLLPKKEDLHNMHSILPESARRKMIRDEDPRLRESFVPRRIDMPVVLICGHKGRDERCGIMGPLLEEEFRAELKRAGFSVPGLGESAMAKSEEGKRDPEAVVGLISHVGGHKFAGNVIVYIPPQYKAGGSKKASASPLAGMGIWYGRVQPRHVEGFVKETVLKGVIIGELFRGGIGADGKPLRIG